jgi:hypothetical protein
MAVKELQLNLGSEYNFTHIERFAEANDMDVEEVGEFRVGEQFVIIRSREKDEVISGVLTGWAAHGSVFKICYSDLQPNVLP